MRGKVFVIGVVLGVLASSAVVVLAGSLDPPSGPKDAASQMVTLKQIYRRLESGIETDRMTSFTEPSSGPGEGTMRTLDEIMAMAPRVDDTDGATAEDVVRGKTFWGLTTKGWGPTTGVAATEPDPACYNNYHRYVDCENGTVHDTVTNLLWLKDANCFQQGMDWTEANDAVMGLEDGECGLTDGSSPGDWRLPTKEEWAKTVARAVEMECTGAYGQDPSLTNKPGTECIIDSWPAFNNFQTEKYWSSTANDEFPFAAWYVNLWDGGMYGQLKQDDRYVWPVRDGQ